MVRVAGSIAPLMREERGLAERKHAAGQHQLAAALG
jgi:hypothetical protein